MEPVPTWERKRPPVNLSVSRETKRLLGVIAEREGTKPSRVVDRLVVAEAARLDLAPTVAEEVSDLPAGFPPGRDPSARATLERITPIVDPQVHAALEDVEYYSTGDPDESQEAQS